MTRMSQLLLAVATTFAALATPLAAQAQGYPARPITLVVGFAPGGGVDIVARQLGERLGALLGQPVVVENKAGAAGNVAMDIVAHAKPDGYTLLMGNLGMLSANPALYSGLTFDTGKDFAPIARVVVTPLVAVVPASLPVKSVPELLALARAKPGEFNFASGGNGNINHLAPALLALQSRTPMQHVPYKGSAPAIADLVAGRVQLMIDGGNVVQPFVKAGTARALFMTGETRSAAMPDVPTAKEAGLDDFVIYGWQGVLAPAGTPQAVIDRVATAVKEALATPELAAKLSAQGTEPAYLPPAAFRTFIDGESRRWAGVIKAANIKID
ncbi:MAG: tripartite tricarboxylate transporter substrate binding protein [Proteobacteria bacterium]|nr:tripartite tricarboxylate transporter substrate binding protein [Pseudomonadota bacterium]